MMNPEKLKKKSASAPLLRRPAPAPSPYFHPMFLIFQTPAQFKKKGGSELWKLEMKVLKSR